MDETASKLRVLAMILVGRCFGELLVNTGGLGRESDDANQIEESAYIWFGGREGKNLR